MNVANLNRNILFLVNSDMISIADTNKRGKYSNAKTGKFLMKNPQKFTGSETPIFKSRLEYLCMKYLDENPNVVQWGYESCNIKYFDTSCNPPRVRRYYIDFVAKIKIGTFVKTVWIEIKPQCEVDKPGPRSKPKTQLTWIKNQCKWKAATQLAQSKGYEFKVITEKQLI